MDRWGAEVMAHHETSGFSGSHYGFVGGAEQFVSHRRGGIAPRGEQQ
jgi:hypothetical protein